MTEKKIIVPHKGGRTERLFLRCTPATKNILKKIALIEGSSVADLIEKWACFFDKEEK